MDYIFIVYIIFKKDFLGMSKYVSVWKHTIKKETSNIYGQRQEK